MYGINPQERILVDQDADAICYEYHYPAWAMGASSFHPGGANFGMADGSVRFIKDTVSTFPYPGTTGTVLDGVSSVGPNNNTYTLTLPTAGVPHLPVFPALTTIAGGDRVNADFE